jgi:putative MATE family efflux protein
MNMILDVVFVAVFHTGVAGAALATSISQFCSLVFAVCYLYPRREKFGFDFKLRSFRMKAQKLSSILRLSVPLMISSICISLSLTFINSYVNPYGVVASAVNGVGSKLSSIMQVVTQAMQTATSAFVGQNVGAGKPERAKRAVYCGLGIGVVFWIVVASVCLIWPRMVFGLFSDELPVLDLAVDYLSINVWNFLAWALMCPALGLMGGVGASTLQLGTSLLDGVVARIGLSLLFGITLSFGLRGFWIGSTLATYVTVILAWAYFLSGRWQKRKLV